MSRWLWPAVGATAGAVVVIAAMFFQSESERKRAGEEWVTRPVGLSLRVAVQHRANAPPPMAMVTTLHTLGEQARRDINECIAGVSGAPSEVVLVFEDGVVSLASGPVSRTTSHGGCVAQVLEGLWGEVDGDWRVVLNLALE